MTPKETWRYNPGAAFSFLLSEPDDINLPFAYSCQEAALIPPRFR